MKLTFDQIQSITHGATRLFERDGRICFSRFTQEQESFFQNLSLDFLYIRAMSSAGVRLEFTTDSPTLSLTIETKRASGLSFVFMDITVNGTLIGSIGSDETPDGIFSGSFDLGQGNKEVRLYFPWSAKTELLEFSLADGSTFAPVSKSKKMLIFGDSITQGASAKHPSHSYASRLADLLDAEAINKGVAGDTFHAELAEMCDRGSFDYITVACGTNDWKKTTREVFEQNCSAFYRILSERHPNSKIFAITPIWRANPERITDVGEFFYIRDFIKAISANLPNVTVIDGYDFVPHDPSYFADLRVHPNDKGFAHYINNLYEQMKKYL